MRSASYQSRKTSFASPKLFLLVIVLLVLYGAVAFSQVNVYINPLNISDPLEDGSLIHPFDSWSDIAVQDNHNYYQMRGTADTIASHISLYRNTNVKFGAYGPGNILPNLTFDNGGTGSELFSIGACQNITIDSLHLSGEPCFPDMLIKVAGDWQVGGWDMDGLTVTNCNIHHGQWNLFMIEGSTTYRNITILNCDVHHSWDDCFYFDHGDLVEVGYCNIHHANQKYFDDPATAGGDGVQFHGTKTAHVHHCTIDRGDTGNKFCIIYNETAGYTEGWIIIENNILTTPNNTGNGGAGIFLKQSPGAIVRYNEIKSASPGTGVVGIYAENDTLLCYYNIFKELPEGIMSGNTDYTEVNNCVFYYNEGMDVNGNGGGYLGLKNNIFFHLPGKTGWSVRDNWITTFENDFNCYNYEYPNMLANVTLGANSIIDDPGFVVNGANFRLQETSPCLNVGANLSIPIDLDSTLVPQGILPEVGTYEFIEGQSTNNMPEIEDQNFQIDENVPNGQVVDTVVATDPDDGQILTYSITNGNNGSAFTINASTGEITVAVNTQLDFETNPEFLLTIQVQDNGTGYLTNQAFISINLNDINENPSISSAAFSVDENSSNGTNVGTVNASDPDNGQSLSFSITGGNTSGTFQIGESSGIITIANNNILDFESNAVFFLLVQVQDNGSGSLTDEATITVNLNDINENPVINNQGFSINEDISNGELVGVVAAMDPDAGQSLTFTITGGNIDNAFQIDPVSGEIIVLNSSAIDAETTPVFYLNVQVHDNGAGNLSDVAIVTVSLSDVNEMPIIAAQSFSVEENSANGNQLGVVVASDPDAGQTLTFSIVSGNSNNAFQIGSANGVLSVANGSALNFEVTPLFNLIVQVQDNGPGNLTNQANITVNILDVNDAPVIGNQGFAIDENSGTGQQVGIVSAFDEDSGQTLSFSIVSGNTNGAFQISNTGIITVANPSVLDFETTLVFSLMVEVEDNGAGNLTDQATITVNINDINESPDINNQFFSIDEDILNGELVGVVVATDPDAGQSLTFTVTGGNIDNAFQVHPTTGTITVANSSAIDIDINPIFYLSVQAQDNGAGNLTDVATITVSLLDVNEMPNIANQNFMVDENSVNGDQLGVVVASDPDAGQTLTYSIVSGNSNNAFQIGSASGVLSVANGSTLNFEVMPVFYLVVQVQDNGPGNLTNQADITVDLLDVNDAPLIVNQDFAIDENADLGQEVGVVAASDEDSGQSLSFSIISGNTDAAFQISPTGIITVANASALDFETTSVFSLIVEVEDNGIGNLTDQATVTIQLNDVNETPSMANQDLFGLVNIEGALFDFQSIGTVLFSDPDIGQTHTFSIIEGNETDIFEIETSSGGLALIAPNQMLQGLNKFVLTVEVYDNTTEQYSATAFITVYIGLIVIPDGFSNSGEDLLEIADNSLGINCSIYPNPASSSLFVDVDRVIDEKLIIEVYNVKGGLIFKKEYSGNSINLVNEYDISTLGKGVYVVNIMNGDKKGFRKFVKQ